MPEALRTSYTIGALSTLGHLLVQASIVAQDGEVARMDAEAARRAARATDDPDAADALNAAAAALAGDGKRKGAAQSLTGAGLVVQSALHLVRSVFEDIRPRQ